MMTREELHELLINDVVTVTFTKADGTNRDMLCTLKESLLPLNFLNGDEQKEQKTRKQNPDVMAVWDMEKMAWRSFRIDSVKSVSGVPA